MNKSAAIIFLISLAFMLSSCSASNPTPCRDVIGTLLDCEATLPSGTVYDMKAPEGNEEYLPDRVLIKLFGDGRLPTVCDGWLDAALFLSLNESPCEFAVILCEDPDNAEDTARLLLRRLDVIRTAKGNGESTAMLSSANVTVIKNYVLMIISSDTQNALKSVSSMIK